MIEMVTMFLKSLVLSIFVFSGVVLLFWIVFKAPLDLKAAGRKLTSPNPE